MDGSGADWLDPPDQAAASQVPLPAPVADGPDGESLEQGAPLLALDGFDGPLDRLLTLARAQQIDLARLSLTALLAQLEAALRQAPVTLPLGQKGDWVVMAAWLLQLRSRLLLPADAEAQQDAAAAADQLRERLVELQAMQALAGWLERRPQLGRDVFVRGRPEVFGVSVEPTPDLDIIEFLWASLARFDDDAAEPDSTSVYRPFHFALYAIAEARARVLRRLAAAPEGATLGQLLPDAAEPAEGEPLGTLRRRSAWSSTFVASLELAKQGAVVVAQEAPFQPIHLART
jgi:segregation and condensation protein A